MMNRMLRNWLLVIGAGIALGGCDGIFELDERPTDFISPETFYKTARDAQAAIDGIYAGLTVTSTYGRDLPRYQGRWTQEISTAAGSSEFRLDWAASGQDFENIWTDHYRIINWANAAIKYIPRIEMSEQLKQRYLGEAHFLRALLYFNLARWWGGVPLSVEPTESAEGLEKPRSSLAETYALIIQDLQYAAEHLPARNGDRASQGAARALLAKVYLTMASQPLGDLGKLQLAHTELLGLVDPGNPAQGRAPYNYALEPDFADLWWQTSRRNTSQAEFAILQPANETGPEFIFSIRFTSTAEGGGSANTGWANQTGTWLRNTFRAAEDSSYRSAHTLNPAGSNWGPTGGQRKFQPTDAVNSNQQQDWPYLRFADVVLMFAEVENELNGPTAAAFAAINAVRERARRNGNTAVGSNPVATYLKPGVPADYTPAQIGTTEAFRQAVYLERLLELTIEGHTWFDWLRTGRLAQMLMLQGRNYDPRLELLPIPRVEIDLSRGLIEQNPGY